MSQSQKMRSAIGKYVIPNLTEKGFVGKHPHYRRIYDDRVELITFQTNKWGNCFTVEISTIFLGNRKQGNNFILKKYEDEKIENLTTWHTNKRYRLKGMYDGWFYYTDVYQRKKRFSTTYNAIGEVEAKNYTPMKNEILVQKADDDIYRKVCEEVNLQMPKAFEWLDAFYKNKKFKMKSLQKYQ